MRRRIPSLVLIACAAMLLLAEVLYSPRLTPWSDSTFLRSWVPQYGASAPVVIILLQAAQVVLAPIPGQATSVAAGHLFGVAPAMLLSTLGTGLGTFVALGLARTLGRPLVQRFVPAEWLSRLDAGARKHGLLFFLLIYLLPFLPDDMACFAAGLTPLPIVALLAVATLGRLPGLWVSCWLGANAAGLSVQEWVLVITGSVLLALAFTFCGGQLRRWSIKLVEHIASDR